MSGKGPRRSPRIAKKTILSSKEVQRLKDLSDLWRRQLAQRGRGGAGSSESDIEIIGSDKNVDDNYEMETDEEHGQNPLVILPDSPVICIRGSSEEPEPETLEISLPQATLAEYAPEYPPRADYIIPAPACNAVADCPVPSLGRGFPGNFKRRNEFMTPEELKYYRLLLQLWEEEEDESMTPEELEYFQRWRERLQRRDFARKEMLRKQATILNKIQDEDYPRIVDSPLWNPAPTQSTQIETPPVTVAPAKTIQKETSKTSETSETSEAENSSDGDRGYISIIGGKNYNQFGKFAQSRYHVNF